MRRMLCVAAVALVAGCSPSLPPKPKAYPVHGTVTLGGQPVHGGTVFFEPVDFATGAIPGKAQVDKDGKYAASAFVDQEGLVAGEFKVYVQDDMRNASQLGAEPTKFPAKYQKAEDSGLKYTVKAEDNTFDIKLD